MNKALAREQGYLTLLNQQSNKQPLTTKRPGFYCIFNDNLHNGNSFLTVSLGSDWTRSKELINKFSSRYIILIEVKAVPLGQEKWTRLASWRGAGLLFINDQPSQDYDLANDTIMQSLINTLQQKAISSN